jgi:hypothetical protein
MTGEAGRKEEDTTSKKRVLGGLVDWWWVVVGEAWVEDGAACKRSFSYPILMLCMVSYCRGLTTSVRAFGSARTTLSHAIFSLKNVCIKII